ncbi:MAG: hypothetical protein K9L31_01205 [Candidatus Pacebacteria bacterium]|nr:hypothetical protein [Candidatus Paceibacterota bacterium]
MINEEGCEIRSGVRLDPPVQIGGAVSSCTVFRVLVYFEFISFYFYFLNGDAVTVFLSIIEQRATVEELRVNRKSKKYYLQGDGNVFGKQIIVEERNGEGVRKDFAVLKEKLNLFLNGLSPLEIGLMQAGVNEELEDCCEHD